MKVQDAYRLPAEKRRARQRAVRLEWWTLGWMASVVVAVGSTMGSSQAMKTAWAEDLLSLVPPLPTWWPAARSPAHPPSATPTAIDA
jgi:hypothetical protein